MSPNLASKSPWTLQTKQLSRCKIDGQGCVLCGVTHFRNPCCILFERTTTLNSWYRRDRRVRYSGEVLSQTFCAVFTDKRVGHLNQLRSASLDTNTKHMFWNAAQPGVCGLYAVMTVYLIGPTSVFPSPNQLCLEETILKSFVSSHWQGTNPTPVTFLLEAWLLPTCI